MDRKTADRNATDRKVINKKLNAFVAVMLLIFLILGTRVAYLQIFESERYRTLARENSLRLISIAAPRGEVYDRNGVKLVGNRPLYNVSLVKLGQSKEDLEPLVQRLSQILNRDPEAIWARIDDPSLRRYERIRIAKDVPLEIVSQIEENAVNLPGVSIELEPMREYPYDSTLAHVLGYIREIQPKQLEQYNDQGYRMGDQFGQDGLENTFEQYLRGEKGAVQFEVDAYDRPIRSLGVREPIPGNDLHLTIDYRVQAAAERALAAAVQAAQKTGKESRAASAVAIDVRNGEVLALASYPAYNPGMFAGDVRAAEAEEVLTSPDRPFINRAVQSSYPPGSSFKMITAIAALESGKITPEFTVHDPGYYWLERMYTCWTYPRGHGNVNVEKGIQVSCNTFFWTVGKMIGPELIAKYATDFGLGSKTGIELNWEASGVVPTAEYKRNVVQAELDRRYNPQFEALEKEYGPLIKSAITDEEKGRLTREMQKERARIQAQYDRYAWELTWRDYDTLNMSIGQGYNAYTPLQLANYVATIANGGTLYRPHLVRQITSPSGEMVYEYQPEVLRRVSVSDENLAIVRKGMSLVTQHGGTGFGVFWDFPVPTAGKTGTAEVVGKDNNGIYVAFAPVENPEIAIAVIVENAGQGSATGAPVAKEMLKAYFDLDVQENDPELVESTNN
ncbi:MAG: penicillin-binding protein 2 [Clostridia bacterium]|nr:penicillin-binding protein 2 [Clostridia bacterium]